MSTMLKEPPKGYMRHIYPFLAIGALLWIVVGIGSTYLTVTTAAANIQATDVALGFDNQAAQSSTLFGVSAGQTLGFTFALITGIPAFIVFAFLAIVANRRYREMQIIWNQQQEIQLLKEQLNQGDSNDKDDQRT